MAETDSKEVEKDVSNGTAKDGGGGKSSQPKKLSANAPVFDVSRSPTLDPYAGPNGIRTLPANVPPATIPPPQQQTNQQQAQQSNQGQQQQLTAQQAQAQQAQQQQQQHLSRSRHSGQPRQGYPQPYDQHDPERDRRNMSYNPNYQKQMAPQHMRHPQQYPPQMGAHQRYPNYPNYPANRGPHPVPPPHDYRPHPQMMNRHPNQPYGHRHPQNPIHPPPPHGGYMQQPPAPQQNGSSTQQATNQQLASPPQQQQQQQQTNGATSNNNNNNNASTNNNNNNNKNTSNTQQSSNALNNGTSNTNGTSKQQQSSTTATTTNNATPAVKPGKVQFKTFTHQKNARPVGSTMAYKHPSRSHYGQPDAKLRDPKFTNPDNLLRLQRWELLESAKRWLPGEGTQITWKNHRYLIGPPIHMGMNGHIHYCYKYPIPKDQRTTKKDRKKKKNGSDKDQKDKTDKEEEQDDDDDDDDDDDEPDIIDIDITSPCVETLAAKIVPNTPAFAREIVILRALQDCENVTELYDVLESERTLISILELAQADVYNFFVGRGSTRHGWNLDKPAVREHFSKMVISNVVQGLDQMHNVKGGGYLHCDLKSLNILLYIYVTDHSNRRGGVYIKAKLTDFGHSSHGTTRIAEKLFSNGMARVGTAGHVAPELFKEGTKCTEKIDIWSLGIVMFSMLVPGRLLFSEYTNLDALKRGYDRLNKMNPWSRDRPSWWTDFERLSPEARDLILWMTRYDPNQRPTCQQILKHPWFLIGKAGHREHYRPSLKYVDMLCSSSIAQE